MIGELARPRRILMVLAAGLAAGGCGAGAHAGQDHHVRRTGRATSTEAAPSVGAFAGYMWPGHVKTVHATWRVPRALAGSGLGLAATWIGAQVAGAKVRAPFIQVGTNEGVLPVKRRPTAIYIAFWSDTAHGFRPLKLFTLRPGDTVTAGLLVSPSRCVVEIADTTRHETATFATRDEIGSRFDMAEWNQEDPTDAVTGRQAPYPAITTVSFHGASINSDALTQAAAESTWMSVTGRYLAPTRILGDGFEIRPARLSSTGIRYLELVKQAAPGVVAFEQAEQTLTQTTPQAALAAMVRTFLRAEKRYVSGLATLPAPPAAMPSIRAVVARAGALARWIRRLPDLQPARGSAWKVRFDRLLAQLDDAEKHARDMLGVPEHAPM